MTFRAYARATSVRSAFWTRDIDLPNSGGTTARAAVGAYTYAEDRSETSPSIYDHKRYGAAALGCGCRLRCVRGGDSATCALSDGRRCRVPIATSTSAESGVLFVGLGIYLFDSGDHLRCYRMRESSIGTWKGAGLRVD